jgi:hypothetical protein
MVGPWILSATSRSLGNPSGHLCIVGLVSDAERAPHFRSLNETAHSRAAVTSRSLVQRCGVKAFAFRPRPPVVP